MAQQVDKSHENCQGNSLKEKINNSNSNSDSNSDDVVVVDDDDDDDDDDDEGEEEEEEEGGGKEEEEKEEEEDEDKNRNRNICRIAELRSSLQNAAHHSKTRIISITIYSFLQIKTHGFEFKKTCFG